MKKHLPARFTLPRSIALVLALLMIFSSIAYASPSGITIGTGAADDHTVLILDTSVVGGMSSVEAVQAIAVGFTVEIADASQWAAKSQANFATYRALILGDRTCGSLSDIQAAIDNRTTWSPAVNGNIMLIGGDPGYHAVYGGIVGAATEIRQSIGFAADVAGKTGLYAAFGCAYTGAPESGTTVDFLDYWGTFKVRSAGRDDVHKVTEHPALAGLDDAALSNWVQSTHAGFTQFPAGWVTIASINNLSGNGNIEFPDETNGVPYMLARGEGLVVTGAPVVTDTTLDVVLTESTHVISITFSEDVQNPGGHTETDDVTNPANYMVLQTGPNGVYDTATCAGGLAGDDISIPVNSVSYNSSSFTATLNVNNGVNLPNGEYRLVACGTTSIVNFGGYAIGGGVDFNFDFSISGSIVLPAALPATGFPMGQVTSLPAQPAEKAYANTELALNIPALGIKDMAIVGIPQSGDNWDVSWLGNSAGYLAGSAFPTWAGNTVLTAHVWDANNNPGPFANLKTLKYGDQFTITAYGMTYTYEVRENKLVSPNNTNAAFKHEKLDWVTLVTCEYYNPFTGKYYSRRMVRAVLVSAK